MSLHLWPSVVDEVTAGFQEFLDLIGKKQPLKGTKEYTGGLNTDGTCGETSYFAKYKDINMAFHVAPMIPQLVYVILGLPHEGTHMISLGQVDSSALP